MDSKIRTGIYGGSFNPIHNGHIAIADKILSLAGLDEVWFVVSPHNPLKQADGLLDDSKRLHMTRVALKGHARLAASDCEFALPRPSYMWNTLRHLSQEWPERVFTLLIGADNWMVFDRWAHHEDIIANYDIAIYPREGCTIDTAQLPPNVRLMETGLYNVSSTMVRDMIKRGEDVSALIPTSIVAMAEQWYR